MALEIIGMTGAIAGGTQDALAQIDVPQDGVLRNIDWDVYADLDADLESVNCELSFIATNLLSINDIRGRISTVSAVVSVLTAVGGHIVSIQKFLGPFELMLSAGERIYMHVESSAGVTGFARCNLHFDGGASVTRRSARRG